MVHQAIHGGHRYGGINKHLALLGEWRVGRDSDALALVALSDQLEQHAGLGLVTAHVAQVVQYK